MKRIDHYTSHTPSRKLVGIPDGPGFANCTAQYRNGKLEDNYVPVVTSRLALHFLKLQCDGRLVAAMRQVEIL